MGVIHISNNEVAVDHDYYWLPMNTCPRGVKVQLLGAGGVAVYGSYQPGSDDFWRGWAPLPKERRGPTPANPEHAVGASTQADPSIGGDPGDAGGGGRP